MIKSSAIIGAVLLIVGGALFGWVFAEQRKEDQLAKQRSENIKADLSKIDAVVGDQIDTSHFEDLAYAARTKEPPAASVKQEQKKELAIMLSSVFGLTGGTILSCCVLFGMARLVKALSSRVTKAVSRPRRKPADEQQQPAQDQADQQDSQTQKQNTANFTSYSTTQEPQQKSKITDNKQPVPSDTKHAAQSDAKQGVPVKENAGQQDTTKSLGQWHQDAQSQKTPVTKTKTAPQTEKSPGGKKEPVMRAAKTTTPNSRPRRKLSQGQNMDVLLSDEESVALEDPSKVRTEVAKPDTKPADVDENATRLEESMKTQTEDFEKRMEQFTQMAQNVQQTALANARPVEQSIRELSQQVSAIREYADNQQERVKKLQDGYDWNIVRNFCLRIIRCVDNLDSRIRMLSERQVDTTALEEVRDELLFALESTGVEQFRPEINSDYRGQEKNTEVIREKEECDDPDLKGRIAVVLRPGYHYFIDEDNVKLIRTAQVKLYC
ncbi:MAG: nucleotide exchange factor GrpE [Planctomycetota bacterium]|jgi:molecular chaperone GrpE (heat shock protein)